MIQSADAMRVMADKAGVTLSVSPLSARLWVDPDRIIQTLTNLLQQLNFQARVYSLVDCRVGELGVSSSGAVGELFYPTPYSLTPYLKFQVRDQGRGILLKSRQSLNAFNRWMPLTLVKGTGLGLDLPQHRAASWRPDLGGKHPRQGSTSSSPCRCFREESQLLTPALPGCWYVMMTPQFVPWCRPC